MTKFITYYINQMKQTAHYQEYRLLGEQFEKEEDLHTMLKLARRIYKLTQALYEDYPDSALFIMSNSAGRLAHLLEMTDGDEYEIEALTRCALEGIEKNESYPEPSRSLALIDLYYRLSNFSADREEEEEAIDYAQKALRYSEILDEKGDPIPPAEHNRVFDLLESLHADYSTKKAHLAFLNQQREYHTARLEISPIIAAALLANIEHRASKIYEDENKPRKTLQAKKAAVDWCAKSLVAQQLSVNEQLLFYKTNLIQHYMQLGQLGQLPRALSLLDEILEAHPALQEKTELTQVILVNALVSKMHCYEQIGARRKIEELSEDATRRVKEIWERDRDSSFGVRVRGALIDLLAIAAQYSSDSARGLASILEAIEHLRALLEMHQPPLLLVKLQKLLLDCGDLYANSRQKKKAKQCYREVVDIDDQMIAEVNNHDMKLLFAELRGEEEDDEESMPFLQEVNESSMLRLMAELKLRS